MAAQNVAVLVRGVGVENRHVFADLRGEDIGEQHRDGDDAELRVGLEFDKRLFRSGSDLVAELYQFVERHVLFSLDRG